MRPTRDSGGASDSSSLIWPCSRWGLPCDPRLRRPGALLPHPFTLACAPERAIGGLLSAALFRRRPKPTPGCYPAPCSTELGLSSIGTTRGPTATLTSHILVSLVYRHGGSRTTAFGTVSERPEHPGGHFAVGVSGPRLVAVFVETELPPHADVVRGPNTDAEGELEGRTPKPAPRGIPVVPAEEPGRNTPIRLQPDPR